MPRMIFFPTYLSRHYLPTYLLTYILTYLPTSSLLFTCRYFVIFKIFVRAFGLGFDYFQLLLRFYGWGGV